MLSCEETKNLLSAYYDGELGVAAANEVAEHLASCEACRKLFEDMSFLSEAFASVKHPEIDEKFTQSLHEKLAQTSKSMRPKGLGVWITKTRPYIAAAACFVLMVGVYAAVHNGQHSTNTQQPVPITAQLQADETQKDISTVTEKISPTPKADTEKEYVATNQNTKRTYDLKTADLKTAKPVSYAVAESENKKNEQAQFSALDEDDENALANSRVVAEDEPNQTVESEVLMPSPSQPSLDVADEHLEGENTQAHGGGGGGGSSAQTKPSIAQFVLMDKTQIEALKDIVYNYGTCDINENYIHLTVLSANYDACIEVLSGLEWLEVSDIQKNSGSEYCYIQIKIQ